jgi:aspartate aminotransferase
MMKPMFRQVEPSVTMGLDAQARALHDVGCDVINLTAGQVDLPMPDGGKEAVLAALKEDKTGYVPAVGSADVKAEVRRRMGWQEGEVLISAGAKPLLYAAVACLSGPGDQVLLPTPCYTSYPEMVRLAGGKPVFVPGEADRDFIVTREALDRRVTECTKAILLNNPVNPTGAVYDREALEQIARVCEKHDLYLIADEVYSSFVYEGAFVSLYAFSSIRDRLILINSASKTFAMAGLRLGYCVAAAPVACAMGAFLSHALGCPCSLSERAALAVLAMDGGYEAEVRKIFRERRDRLCDALSPIDGWAIKKNAGAFYLWLDVRDWEDDVAFCRKLLAQEGVALTPGSAFCCPGYVRLAYTKDVQILLEAAERMKRFVQKNYSRASGVSS